MTPFEISVLLHYHTRPGDFWDGDWDDAPIARPTVEQFVSAGLLKHSDMEGQFYEATEATAVYMEAICAVPAPVLRWVMPYA